MRVYFVGAHATGKTTMARYVSATYGLPMITEVARSVLAELEAALPELRTDLALVDRYQGEVFARQMRAERKLPRGFVSDRAFDNLAYAAEHSRVTAQLAGTPDFQRYMRWVAKGRVFFLRPHHQLLVDDGVREPVEWDSVVRIDGMVKLLLEMHAVPYLPIATASMQERCRAVDFVLK